MARISRFGGAARIGYGAAALGAGVSKIGIGAHSAYGALRKPPFKPLQAGKGFEKIYAGARALRSGFRNIRQGIARAHGQGGHTFHGNQYVKVQSRATLQRGSYSSTRGRSSGRRSSRGSSRGGLRGGFRGGSRGGGMRRLSAGRGRRR